MILVMMMMMVLIFLNRNGGGDGGDGGDDDDDGLDLLESEWWWDREGKPVLDRNLAHTLEQDQYCCIISLEIVFLLHFLWG